MAKKTGEDFGWQPAQKKEGKLRFVKVYYRDSEDSDLHKHAQILSDNNKLSKFVRHIWNLALEATPDKRPDLVMERLEHEKMLAAQGDPWAEIDTGTLEILMTRVLLKVLPQVVGELPASGGGQAQAVTNNDELARFEENIDDDIFDEI